MLGTLPYLTLTPNPTLNPPHPAPHHLTQPQPLPPTPTLPYPTPPNPYLTPDLPYTALPCREILTQIVRLDGNLYTAGFPWKPILRTRYNCEHISL